MMRGGRISALLALVLLAFAGCAVRTSGDPAAVAVAEQMFREMRLTR